MTYLLAGVTSLREAEIAFDAGADIIDLRSASPGAFGALPVPVVTETVALIARRRPVWATAGDAPLAPEALAERVAALADTGVDYIKVGLFGDGSPAYCIAALAPLAQHVALVGVLFADQRPDLGLLPLLARGGFAGIMLDTADKSAGSLRRHVADAGLGRFIGRAAMDGLLCGLAGSLTAQDVVPLLALGPDFLGFRGALCAGGDRHSEIDPAAVARVRQEIPRHGETDLRAPQHGSLGAVPGGISR
jgi:dihydroneopterin aldolase